MDIHIPLRRCMIMYALVHAFGALVSGAKTVHASFYQPSFNESSLNEDAGRVHGGDAADKAVDVDLAESCGGVEQWLEVRRFVALPASALAQPASYLWNLIRD